MSLGQVASTPPQSAPAAPPGMATPPPAESSPPAADTPTAAPALAGAEPKTATIGDNGGPDWRAVLAGEDAKSIEALARYQSPQDFLKSWNEQRAALSKRAEPVKLPDNATPEQVSEYRKGLGVPEVARDADPKAYLEAYKIAPPEGYDLSQVESGMLTDYAKLAYEQGHSPREVKAATDFFFQQQAASTQALNRIAVDFQKAQQNTLRDELGSKEYEAQQQAGEAWLKEQFKDDPNGLVALLNARMPNGGLLGDSSWFFKLVAGKAMGEGYTDRIEAVSLESSGKTLAQQQSEIENLRFKDKAGYDAAMAPGGKYEKILAARQSRGEIDDQGNEVRRRRAS